VILSWIELHDISAYDWALHSLNNVNCLARGQTSWLAVRYARSKRGIEPVYVEGNVDRTIKRKNQIVIPVLHLDHFYTKAVDLIALVTVQSANADLHQTLHQLFFHDSCERTSVRITIALELIIEIGMRVEMEDVQAWKFFREGSDYGYGDGMIATKRYWQ